MVVKVGVAKLGNIASGVMAELLLDERADREDMQTFMATSGTKLEPADVDRVVSNMKAWKPDFCIVVSPNGVLPGPTGAREQLAAAGIPVVIITDDVTTKKEWEGIKTSKFGYIFSTARRPGSRPGCAPEPAPLSGAKPAGCSDRSCGS